jgi:transposase-like protein
MTNPIPPEVKAAVLAQIKNDGVTAAQAARDHGVNSKTVYGWLAKETQGEPGILEVNRLKRELKQAYEVLGRLSAVVESQKKGRSH